MNDRWAAVRARAAAARATARSCSSAEGFALVAAALTARGLDLLPLTPGDLMLRGARAVYDVDFVGYDCSLPKVQAAFALAHELGHALLHEGQCQCADADIDERTATGLLAAGPAVDVYNARQARELEANVFATAFLLPPDELRTRFLAGASYEEIAAHFGVSTAAALHALADTLLQPVPPPAVEPPIPTTAVVVDLDESQAEAARTNGPVLVAGRVPDAPQR